MKPNTILDRPFNAFPEWYSSLPEELKKEYLALPTQVAAGLKNLGTEGLNNNLVSATMSLWDYCSPETIRGFLKACGAHYKRHVKSEEIDRAIKRAEEYKKGENIRTKWLKKDPQAAATVIAQSPIKSVDDFLEKYDRTDGVYPLDSLFRPDDLICVGPTPQRAYIYKYENLAAWVREQPMHIPEFIVPATMRGQEGLTKDDRPSARCENNVKARKCLIVEFDGTEPDDQLRIIDHLAQFAPLLMVVHSGGKSYHAWFVCVGEKDSDLIDFMRYAVKLGADRAMWQNSQFCRMPGAYRHDKQAMQAVIAYRPVEAKNEHWNYSAVRKLLGEEDSFPFVDILEIEYSLNKGDFVEGLLTYGGLSVIYGNPGSGKSFLALDLFVAVASGKRWRGRDVVQCPVIYFCLEGGHGFMNRIELMKRENMIPDSIQFKIVTESMQLLKDGRKIAKTIEQAFPDCDNPVVVIDTLSRATAGADENSAKDMMEMIGQIDIAQRDSNAHFCLVHHSGKDAIRGLRGSSSLLGAVDTSIHVGRLADSPMFVANVQKQKDLELSAPIAFTLETKLLDMDARGNPITSCIVREATLDADQGKPGAKRKCESEQLLELLPVKNVTEWKERAEAEFGIKSSTFHKAKRELPESSYKQTKNEIVAVEVSE